MTYMYLSLFRCIFIWYMKTDTVGVNVLRWCPFLHLFDTPFQNSAYGHVVRPTLIDTNPVELKFYPFMISLDKCTGSCNVLSRKICIPKETKGINVKAFNMITNKNESKATTEDISCDCKCKFNSTTCNSNQ